MCLALLLWLPAQIMNPPAGYCLTPGHSKVSLGVELPCAWGLYCVGILTLLPIKTLIYLAQKLPPKKNHFPVSVPSAYEEEF